jgi:stringent starvation protein B
MEMTSTRPYLIRAIYEWIVDNRCKPFLLIDASVPGVRVPPQAIKDGQVLLNIAPHSVDRLDLGFDEIRFNARFSGVSQSIIAPVAAVLAIYAQENGQGMMFPAETGTEADGAGEETAADAERTGPVSATANTPIDDEPPQPPPARMRPSLRIVK